MAKERFDHEGSPDKNGKFVKNKKGKLIRIACARIGCNEPNLSGSMVCEKHATNSLGDMGTWPVQIKKPESKVALTIPFDDNQGGHHIGDNGRGA